MPKRMYNTPHRTRVVKTRMTDEEYDFFLYRLSEHDISQSEFIRRAICEKEIVSVIRIPKWDEEFLNALGKLTAEYGRIGNNLNQIARHLNEYGTPYVAAHPHLEKVALFVDNGYTGTDFLRPEFTRMMEAVQTGIVDCVIVKDLSRLGRNYIETSQFIEKVCPFFGLRFIAVNDNYDTATVTSEGQLSASLSNIVNDYYAKDISRKVSSALRMKMERGDYIGNYAPHGYQKDPENKNHLIICPETAPVIRQIFECAPVKAS